MNWWNCSQMTSQKEVARCQFLPKTQILDQKFLLHEGGTIWSRVFYRQFFSGYIYPTFMGKILLCHQAPVPHVHKACFLPPFQSCVKKHEGQTVPLYEKRCQVRVFCEVDYHTLLLPWLTETVMSDDFPARMATELVLWKLQCLTKICCFNEEKNEPVCFFGRFEAATIQLLQRENIDLPSGPIPGSQKHSCLSFAAVWRHS